MTETEIRRETAEESQKRRAEELLQDYATREMDERYPADVNLYAREILRLRERETFWKLQATTAGEELAEVRTQVERVMAVGSITSKGVERLVDAFQKAKEGLGVQIDDLRVQNALLTTTIEGTDPLAADPSKWGLRSLLKGVTKQRDSALSNLASMIEAVSSVLPPTLRVTVVVEAARLNDLKGAR